MEGKSIWLEWLVGFFFPALLIKTVISEMCLKSIWITTIFFCQIVKQANSMQYKEISVNGEENQRAEGNIRIHIVHAGQSSHAQLGNPLHTLFGVGRSVRMHLPVFPVSWLIHPQEMSPP